MTREPHAQFCERLAVKFRRPTHPHGMIRAIYECARIGEGTPYEMSLGDATAKLASCLPCSIFMIANGYDPSHSHLGKGESWSPLYHTENHVHSFKEDKVSLPDAIKSCNEKWASHVREWMWTGVRAMQEQLGWVEPGHRGSVTALYNKLGPLGHSPTDLMVPCNLFLDAMSYHESDAVRLDRTLVFGDNPRKDCGPGTDGNGEHDWRDIPDWRNFKNPFSDEEIKRLLSATLAPAKV